MNTLKSKWLPLLVTESSEIVELLDEIVEVESVLEEGEWDIIVFSRLNNVELLISLIQMNECISCSEVIPLMDL